MKKRRILFSLAAATLAAGLVAKSLAAGEKEETVKLDSIPQAVHTTLSRYAKDSEVKKAEKGDQDGTVDYEFEIKQGAREFEVAIDTAGNYLGMEEEIKVPDLPDAVRQTLQSAASDGKILSAEKATDKDGKVSFEAEIKKDGKKVEATVSADGKLLKTEADNDEKDNKD